MFTYPGFKTYSFWIMKNTKSHICPREKLFLSFPCFHFIGYFFKFYN